MNFKRTVVCSRPQCGCVREWANGRLSYHYPTGSQGLHLVCKVLGHFWIDLGEHYGNTAHGSFNLTPEDEAAIADLLDGKDQP